MSLITRFWKWLRLSPDPTADFWYSPIGTQTVAGVRVDESSAMTYAACWACTRVLSTGGAMAPLELLRELEEGGSEPATDMRRYNLATTQFNPNMTNFMFRARGLAQQINWGNAYGEIEYTNGGQVAAIHPIHSSRIPAMNVRRNADGSVYYLVNNDNGSQTRLESWEMLHVPSPISDDGIVGKGVITQARLSIGFGLATETQGAAYMGNSARPTVVITGLNAKDKETREEFRRQWEETHGGPSRNARPAMLPKDTTLTALNWSAEDSQFLATRQHNVEEVARWYGVPPHMIGHLLRSTYNNIEHQSIEFVRWTLRPWLLAWEQELDRKLLTIEERKTLYFCHDLDDLERGDLPSRTAAYKEQFFNGKITLDEWRAKDNERPIGGPAGKTHFVQQAMIPVDMALKGPSPPPAAPQKSPDQPAEPPADMPPAEGTAAVSLEMLAALNRRIDEEAAKREQLAAATLEVIETIVAGMLEREQKQALEASRKPAAFLKWLDGFYPEHAAKMTTALAKPFKACLLARGRTDCIDDALKRAVELHISAGREALLQAAGSQPDEFPAAVERCVSTWDRGQIKEYLSNGHH